MLLEIGTIATTSLFGLAGHIGGVKILEETQKGTAMKDIIPMVHEAIKGFAVDQPYIAIFMAIGGVGALLGVVNLFLAYRKGK